FPGHCSSWALHRDASPALRKSGERSPHIRSVTKLQKGNDERPSSRRPRQRRLLFALRGRSRGVRFFPSDAHALQLSLDGISNRRLNSKGSFPNRQATTRPVIITDGASCLVDSRSLFLKHRCDSFKTRVRQKCFAAESRAASIRDVDDDRRGGGD